MTDTQLWEERLYAELQPRLDESDARFVLDLVAGIVEPPEPTGRPVLQDWVAELPMMQQSVLLTAVRGPDGLPKYHPVKYLLRWYRRCILLSSFLHRVIPNPIDTDGGSFLGASIPDHHVRCVHCRRQFYLHDAAEDLSPDVADHEFVADATPSGWVELMDDRVTSYITALDEVPHHFQLHLLHAVEIVGYKHPDDNIADWWREVYMRLVHDMHLWPETREQLDQRLGDSRAGWLARSDVATNA